MIEGVTLFQLSDEQKAFKKVMRDFSNNKIAPRAQEVDRNSEFPWESFKDCVSLDLPALGIPSEYGGLGADHVTQSIMIEELAHGCASTALSIMISKLGMIPVINWGSESLKEKYLPRIASGEAQASYALSEADAGSDVAALKTTARFEKDRYILNGTKYWITNAGISDTYTVFAKTDPAAGYRGISAFLVEASWGVQVAKLESKMGVRGSPTGEIVLENVEVPLENRIGDEGQGFYIAMGTLDRSRPSIGAQAVGIAQGALDFAVDYMKSRTQFGRAIAEFQGLQFMVADMATRIEAARGLVYHACSLVDDDPDGELTRFGAMAKMFASDTAMGVTVDALQLLGGYGFTKDFPMERFMRDAKITQIYEGTNQIQRIVIAKKVIGS